MISFVPETLDRLAQQVVGFLRKEHNVNGTHRAITAESATVAGDSSGGVFNATGTLRPPQITADQNNYNPVGLDTASHVYLSVDAARNITGLAPQAHGRLLMLANGSAFDITLKVNSASSTPSYRFAIANAADVVLRPNNGSVLLRYDAQIGSGFWFVIGA